MCAGCGFKLTLHRQPAAIQLNVGGLRNRGNFFGRRQSTNFIKLDAIRVSGTRFGDGVSILHGEQGFVGHHRYAHRLATYFGHAGEIAPVYRLFDVTQIEFAQRVRGGECISHAPAGVGIDTDHHVVAHRFAYGLKVLHVLPPATTIGGFDTQHFDAKFVDRARRFVDDGLHIVRQTH